MQIWHSERRGTGLGTFPYVSPPIFRPTKLIDYAKCLSKSKLCIQVAFPIPYAIT